MKSKLFICLCFIAGLSTAQVGIGTNEPKATLQIVGLPTDVSVMDGVIFPRITGDQLLEKNYQTAQQGAVVYVTDAATNPVGQVAHVNASGLYYFDSSTWKVLGEATNSLSDAVYSASKTGGWSLLTLNIGNWAKVNLVDLAPKFGGVNINSAGEYVAPSAGYYHVAYEWQLESGANLDILSSKKLGVIKNPGTTNELVESKNFDGIRIKVLTIDLASVPLTSTIITTMVKLDQGDRLAFVTESSLVNAGLLSTAKVTVNVHKIAD